MTPSREELRSCAGGRVARSARPNLHISAKYEILTFAFKWTLNRPGESGVSGTSRRGSARLQPSHLTVGMPCDVVPTTLGRCIFRLLHHEEDG
jgi:hypothetical protein